MSCHELSVDPCCSKSIFLTFQKKRGLVFRLNTCGHATEDWAILGAFICSMAIQIGAWTIQVPHMDSHHWVFLNIGPVYPKLADLRYSERSSNFQSANSNYETPQLPLHVKAAESSALEADSQPFRSYNPSHNVMHSTNVIGDAVPQQHIISTRYGDAPPGLASSEAELHAFGDSRLAEGGIRITKELSLEIEDLKIPWSDLVLKERIGAGNSLSFLKVL